MFKLFFILAVVVISAQSIKFDRELAKQYFSVPLGGSTATGSGTGCSGGGSGGTPATTVAPATAPGAGPTTSTFTPDKKCLNNPTKPTITDCCLDAADPVCATPPATPDPLCPASTPACTATDKCLPATDALCKDPGTPATPGATPTTTGSSTSTGQVLGVYPLFQAVQMSSGSGGSNTTGGMSG